MFASRRVITSGFAVKAAAVQTDDAAGLSPVSLQKTLNYGFRNNQVIIYVKDRLCSHHFVGQIEAVVEFSGPI